MTTRRTDLKGISSPTLSGVSSGYQVFGDVLQCWGLDEQTGQGRIVTFPRAFKAGTTPVVTVSTFAGTAKFAIVDSGTAISNSQVAISAKSDAGGDSDANIFWHAVGEAADADKR